MSQPLSIIIVNYNGEAFLKDSILSFRKFMLSHHIEHEILIFDNASTDRSAEIINSICSEEKEIRAVFSNINLGFSKANNLLIDEAIYPTLVLLNNDTLSIDLHHLCSMAEKSLIDNNTVYTCTILNSDFSTQKNTFNYPRLFNVFVDLFLIKKPLLRIYAQVFRKNLVVENGYFSGCYLIINKELFFQAGGFDETFFFYHEECDLFLRLEKFGIQKRILKDRIVHFGSGGTVISDFSFQNYYLNLARLLMKNNYSSPGGIKFLFSLGFRFRIMLLRMGIKIEYSPFANTYRTQRNLSFNKQHLIILHKETLSTIKKLHL
jgi:GT2 family glycosyltransferase